MILIPHLWGMEPSFLFGGGTFSTCATLDIPEVKTKINSFDIIPNPASSMASVSFFTDKTEFVRISIFDHLGRFIENMEAKCVIGTNNITLDLSIYASGLYLIKVATDSFTETKKTH